MLLKRFNNKIYKALVLSILCVLIFSSCTPKTTNNANTSNSSSSISVNFSEEELNDEWSQEDFDSIVLKGDSIESDGDGAIVKDNILTIVSGGTYVISGTLNDGQILINSKDEETVRVILNGANINCSDNSPIYVVNSDKTILTLAKNTKNTLTDGKTYTLESGSDEPNAALFSKDDLTINGEGSLTVTGNYKNGISSKDELKIVSGNISVQAAEDGIRGRDFIAVKNGTITIQATSDGMQSNNDQNSSKGFVYIENGEVDIEAGNDGIQGETKVLVKNGDINIKTGGGNENGVSHEGGQRMGFSTNTKDINNTDLEDRAPQRIPPSGEYPQNIMPDDSKPDNPISQDENAQTTDTQSAKGIKAGVDITIDSGNMTIDSADDAIHSNDSLTINGGEIQIHSGDDGIHSDGSLTLNNGTVHIQKSYEGIESSSIAINDGSFHIASSDDGINTAGGNDGSSINGRPGQNNFDSDDGSHLEINGGEVIVNADGDGIDVNGTATINDGLIIVNGPTNDGNGSLDYAGSLDVNGGILVTAGSAGMAQAPSSSSKQNSIKINLDSVQSKGTLIHVEDEKGKNILTFTPAEDYQCVILSSPTIKGGSTYTIYTGGKSTGEAKDGYYSGGTYSDGTKLGSIKIENIVTEYGTSSGNMQGGGRPNNVFSGKQRTPGQKPNMNGQTGNEESSTQGPTTPSIDSNL